MGNGNLPTGMHTHSVGPALKLLLSYTVKPDLKTTCIKWPPVLRDHLQIKPREITIILSCIKRPPVFKDQRPLFCYKSLQFRDHLFPQIFINLCENILLFSCFKLDEEMDEINCFNGLFNLFAFHFQHSSTYCMHKLNSTFKVTNAFGNQTSVKRLLVLRDHF